MHAGIAWRFPGTERGPGTEDSTRGSAEEVSCCRKCLPPEVPAAGSACRRKRLPPEVPVAFCASRVRIMD